MEFKKVPGFPGVGVHHPGNTKPIEVLNAYLSRDKDGNEGIAAVGTPTPGGGISMMCLIWSERDNEPPQDMIDMARAIGKKVGTELVKASFVRVG